MKFRIMTLFASIILTLSITNVVFASEEGKTTVKNFEKSQLSDGELLEKALAGELVNNEHTKVTVTDDLQKGEQIIEIEKKLNEEVSENGDVIAEYEKNTVIFVDVGYRHHIKYPPSRSVSIDFKVYYEERTIKGYSTRRITKYSILPKVLDSQFHFVSIKHHARSTGTGFYTDGRHHTGTEDTGEKTIQPINPNTTYTYNTNFVKNVPYDPPGVEVWSGVLGEYSYRRGNGSIITHPFSVGF